MGCCGGKELRSGGVTFGSGVAPGAGAPDRSPLVRTHTAKTADATEVLDRCATRLEQLEESAVAACEQAQEARTCAPSGSTAGDDPTTDEHRLPSGSVLLEASDRRLRSCCTKPRWRSSARSIPSLCLARAVRISTAIGARSTTDGWQT